jgi:nicotinate-nucleotide adenylyltransferase
MRLGILGGTFNPPHLGHLICAEVAYEQLELDRLLFVPTGVAPHKPRGRDDPGAEVRLRLCQAAVAGDERFDVSPVEVERPGPSYTVDTLRLLHERAPDTELFFIVGGDAAASLPRWRDPEGILGLATLAIARRSGTSGTRLRSVLSALPVGDRSRTLRMPQIGISSTLVRSRVQAGRPIRYLVPQEVESLIAAESLYRGEGQIA